MTNFRLFELKEFADDNFKFDENERRFTKPVGNTVGKGEIARYEQFLLSQSVFKRLVMQTCKKPDLFGKVIQDLTFSQRSPGFYVSALQVFR